MRSQFILLVEDNEDDVFLIKRAIKGAGILNPLQVVGSGQEAIEYLSGQGRFADRVKYPEPSLVFLDLKLPVRTGHEVLEWIRDQHNLEKLPVIVLSSSNQVTDVRRAYELGADSYLVKPPKPAQLAEIATAHSSVIEIESAGRSS